MSSRSTYDMHPELAHLMQEFQARCEVELKKYNASALIICTWRSMEEQADLYATGRSKPGNPCRCGGASKKIGTCAKHPLGLTVTNAKPGQSAHNTMIGTRPASEAFDVLALRAGKQVWATDGNGLDDDTTDDLTDNLELWQVIGRIGKEVGFEWAGDWKTFKEFPHFQRKGWRIPS